MECADIMLKVIKRQTEGVHFHGSMVDYYTFLHLKAMKKLHEHQVEEESETLRWIKDEYIEEFSQLPFVMIDKVSIIPDDWKGKTSKEVTKGALKVLGRESLAAYLKWEEDTLVELKEFAKELKEHMNFHSYGIVRAMVKDVQKEIIRIKEIMVEAQSYDYDPEFLKCYIYELLDEIEEDEDDD